jgi:hypothetical protein
MNYIVVLSVLVFPALLDAQAIYEQMSLAFGQEKLQSSISSSLTLSHSIQRVSTHSNEEGKRIGCAPYLHAHDLIHETTILQPNVNVNVILASHAANAVCFLFDYLPTDLSAKLSFEYFVPAALKVRESSARHVLTHQLHTHTHTHTHPSSALIGAPQAVQRHSKFVPC